MVVVSGGSVPVSGGHGRQPDGVTMPEAGEGLQAHVAAPDGPFVVLLQHQGADEADDRGLVGERSGRGTR